MRRGFASLLMGLSLVVASAGWAGIVLTRSVLNEEHSQELSARLMDHEAMRSVMTGRLAEGMERHVPTDEPMSQRELRAAAIEVLTDPPAASALSTSLSEAHVLGLANKTSDPSFSDFDVNEAARRALIAARPSLRDDILVNPLVKVRLPVEGLPWFAGLSSAVGRFATPALAMALLTFVTTFVMAAEPMTALRRSARWILGAAFVWLTVGPVFAALVRFAAPSSYIMFAVAMETAMRSMRDPAIVMASFGVGMLSAGYLAPAFARRRGALLIERATALTGAVAVSPTTDAASAIPSVTAVESMRSGDRMQAKAPVEAATRAGRMASGLSAAWMEGHGYLDDARVAPFFSGPSRES